MPTEREWREALEAPPAGAGQALAPAGVMTVAINVGNPVLARQRADGGLQGISVELARAVAGWLDVPLNLRTYPSAGAVVAATGKAEWDIAFLAVDPQRAAEIHFTAPYLTIEASYLVAASSPFQSVGDVDKDGTTIAATTGAAFTLHLERSLRSARLTHMPTVAEASNAFLSGGFDALAGIRPSLEALVAANPEYRVLPDSFLKIEQAMATQRSRTDGAAILDLFLDRAMQLELAASLVAEAA